MRARARDLAALAALVALASGGAGARGLPTLSVRAFVLSSDDPAPRAERPFHLVLDARLDGRVADLEGVVLPPFDALEILGDEKHTISGAASSEYRETISVVAHRGGEIDIAPAYFDARDARDGKAKRFLSNGLALHAAGPASAAAAATGGMLRNALAFAAGGLVVLALALAALRLRRVPQTEVAAEPAADVLVPSAEPEGDAVASAREGLAADRTRAGALAARALLWRHAGANEGETLADALQHPGAHDPALRAVLRAIERASFTDDRDRAAAIDDALRAMDAYRA